jgi:hypothetical protein
MDLALSIFGVVIAVVCVWLKVRIVNQRERWAKRTAAAALLLPLLYLGSFVILVHCVEPTGIAASIANVVYAPIGWLFEWIGFIGD